MQHLHLNANGARFHVVRAGKGPPILLLHGWPEFWATWEPVIGRLADRFTLIAPDLRGFGDSDKPGTAWGAADHAADLMALLDQLEIDRIGVVGHDVGGATMQVMARMAPKRWTGLFFFDFVHAGIGARMGAPDRLNHIWYQSFHQMPYAAALVGASRDTCAAYIGGILRRWSHNPAWIEAQLDRWIDNFMAPGNLEGGFAYYRAAHAGRIALMQGTAPPLPPIAIPTCVRWAAHDSLFPAAWTDTLGETFTDLDCAILEGVGHFPHQEDPDAAAREIAAFFGRL